MAEAALLTPFFVMLMFGSIEFGSAFRDYLTTSNAATAGARTAAIEGNTNDADWWILQSIYSASTAMPKSQITTVDIFHATSTSTGPPSCPSATTGSQCIQFTGSTLQGYLGATTEPTSFKNTCTATSPSGNWCPSTRSVAVDAGVDYIGVYVQIRHPWVTGLFGRAVTMSQTSVIQLEPQQLTGS